MRQGQIHMERTNYVTKVISVILFAALAVYFCVYAYKSIVDPYTTMTAVTYTMGDSSRASGIIVRQESLFTTDESYVSINKDEGQKVAAGEAVATAYSTEEQMKLAQEISQLTIELEQLEKYSAKNSTEGVTADSAIKSSIMEMNYALSNGDLDGLEEYIINLRSLVFSGDTEETSEKVSMLKSNLDTLKGKLNTSGKSISIDSSGIFSANVDGYENITPADLDSMSASQLKELISGNGISKSNALGKLATGINWYLALIVSKEEAKNLLEIKEAGGTVEVELSGVGTTTYNMSIDRVDGDSECIAILSCNNSLGETLSERVVEADIIHSSQTGIRVLKEAVYQDDEGNYCVYTEKAMQAELHYVTILAEDGDYYLVESSDKDTEVLREGSKIIVKASNLYDGKVIA